MKYQKGGVRGPRSIQSISAFSTFFSHKHLPGTKVLLQKVGDEEWRILDVYGVARHLPGQGRLAALALPRASQLRDDMGEELKSS